VVVVVGSDGHEWVMVVVVVDIAHGRRAWTPHRAKKASHARCRTPHSTNNVTDTPAAGGGDRGRDKWRTQQRARVRRTRCIPLH
jgi:hypothetical protein